MMNEERIAHYLKEMMRGELSRNRCFDAYADREIREAKRLQVRLASLERFLEMHRKDELFWELRPDRRRQQLHHLTCVSHKLHATWAAFLKPFELKLLLEYPHARRIFGAALAETNL